MERLAIPTIKDLQVQHERDQARIKELEAQGEACRNRINQDSHNYLELEAERDRYKAALGRIAARCRYRSGATVSDDVCSIVAEALTSPNP